MPGISYTYLKVRRKRSFSFYPKIQLPAALLQACLEARKRKDFPMKKKKIQLLIFAMAGCLILSSCTVLDALQKSWEFQQNYSFNKGDDNSQNTQDSPGESSGSPENEPTEEQKKEQAAFEEYLDRLFADMLQEDPFSVHFTLEHPEEYGITVENYVLADYEEPDEDELEKEWEAYENSVRDLKRFDRDLLTEQQQLLYDKLMYNWELNEAYGDTIDYSSFIGGSNGIVFSLADTFYEYAFLEEKDIEDYLKFLEDLPNYIDYAIEQTEDQIAEDFVPSKYMLQTNINNIDTICSGENNIFLDGFEQKIEEASFLTDAEREGYLEENEKKVDAYVTPAFSKLKSTMEDWQNSLDEYKGLYAMEDGRRYYEYLAASYTGSSMSVNEMYRYLIKKKEVYEEALSDLLSSDAQTYRKISSGEYGFSLTDPKDILNNLKEYADTSFPSFSDPGYGISWLPEALQSDGLLAYYLVPQIDTDVTNVIRLNPKNLDGDMAQLYMTLAHEGYPGHLYASNYIAQQGWHPLNSILNYSGYTEGWAEYAGMRSLYHWDLTGRLAEALILNEELGYILQAITDIGINYKGWTLDDMCSVWSSYYEIEDKEEMKYIYDYFVAEPGVILSYPMGYLQIMDLRNSVRTVLGKSFEETEFVEAFLNVGGAPFSIAEDYVMKWANKKADLSEDTSEKGSSDVESSKAFSESIAAE